MGTLRRATQARLRRRQLLGALLVLLVGGHHAAAAGARMEQAGTRGPGSRAGTRLPTQKEARGAGAEGLLRRRGPREGGTPPGGVPGEGLALLEAEAGVAATGKERSRASAAVSEGAGVSAEVSTEVSAEVGEPVTIIVTAVLLGTALAFKGYDLWKKWKMTKQSLRDYETRVSQYLCSHRLQLYRMAQNVQLQAAFFEAIETTLRSDGRARASLESRAASSGRAGERAAAMVAEAKKAVDECSCAAAKPLPFCGQVEMVRGDIDREHAAATEHAETLKRRGQTEEAVGEVLTRIVSTGPDAGIGSVPTGTATTSSHSKVVTQANSLAMTIGIIDLRGLMVPASKDFEIGGLHASFIVGYGFLLLVSLFETITDMVMNRAAAAESAALRRDMCASALATAGGFGALNDAVNALAATMESVWKRVPGAREGSGGKWINQMRSEELQRALTEAYYDMDSSDTTADPFQRESLKTVANLLRDDDMPPLLAQRVLSFRDNKHLVTAMTGLVRAKAKAAEASFMDAVDALRCDSLTEIESFRYAKTVTARRSAVKAVCPLPELVFLSLGIAAMAARPAQLAATTAGIGARKGEWYIACKVLREESEGEAWVGVRACGDKSSLLR